MVRLLGLMAAPAAAAVFALGVPAHAQAGVKAVHWIEWRHSGLCLTAKSENAGSPVVLARCGHGHQAWNVTGRRVRLAGTRELLAVGPAALAVLAPPHTRAGRHARWRYSASRHVLRETWWTRRIGRVMVLRWRRGTVAGQQAWMDWWYRPYAGQETWRLPRA